MWFDINGDGVIDRVAWTRRDSDDGFLVLDRNGNGVIDDGRELFGTVTIKSDGTTAINGFNALLDLDGGTAHTDGRIDENDLVYQRLRIWVDRNHNGISEPDELLTLREAGVNAIQTGYSLDGHTDQHGNLFAFAGTALVDRRGVEVPRVIYDVFLKRF